MDPRKDLNHLIDTLNGAYKKSNDLVAFINKGGSIADGLQQISNNIDSASGVQIKNLSRGQGNTPLYLASYKNESVIVKIIKLSSEARKAVGELSSGKNSAAKKYMLSPIGEDIDISQPKMEGSNQMMVGSEVPAVTFVIQPFGQGNVSDYLKKQKKSLEAHQSSFDTDLLFNDPEFMKNKSVKSPEIERKKKEKDVQQEYQKACCNIAFQMVDSMLQMRLAGFIMPDIKPGNFTVFDSQVKLHDAKTFMSIDRLVQDLYTDAVPASTSNFVNTCGLIVGDSTFGRWKLGGGSMGKINEEEMNTWMKESQESIIENWMKYESIMTGLSVYCAVTGKDFITIMDELNKKSAKEVKDWVGKEMFNSEVFKGKHGELLKGLVGDLMFGNEVGNILKSKKKYSLGEALEAFVKGAKKLGLELDFNVPLNTSTSSLSTTSSTQSSSTGLLGRVFGADSLRRQSTLESKPEQKERQQISPQSKSTLSSTESENTPVVTRNRSNQV